MVNALIMSREWLSFWSAGAACALPAALLLLPLPFFALLVPKKAAGNSKNGHEHVISRAVVGSSAFRTQDLSFDSVHAPSGSHTMHRTASVVTTKGSCTVTLYTRAEILEEVSY